MTYVAIMKIDGVKCAKYQRFDTEVVANTYIAEHTASYPDAYVVPTPDFPLWRWVCDAVAQTVTDRGPETNNEIALRSPLKRWQFHAMLGLLGKSRDVEDAMDAMTDGNARAVAKAKLAHTDSFDRDDPLFDLLKSDVGLSDAEIDDAWVIAKDLT